MSNSVPVCKPYFPPLEKYQELLKDIWNRRWLTNNGPILLELEKRLEEIFSAHVIVTTNGTVALEVLIQSALTQPASKLITTPFSFVGTTTAILRTGHTPYFCDINKDHLMIDISQLPPNPAQLGISALMITQVYGEPGPWKEYEAYAKQHGLKLFYDAAHSFGNVVEGRALPSLGDGAALSFHATKVFGTAEGGAVVTTDPSLAERARAFRSFGFHNGEYLGAGTNGKLSELHAAFGLCSLDEVGLTIQKRSEVFEVYKRHLPPQLRLVDVSQRLESANFSYCPIIFSSESILLKAERALAEQGFVTRRYFYPSIDMWCKSENREPLPVSSDISSRILCLPLFHDLQPTEVERICLVLNDIVSFGKDRNAQSSSFI